MEVFYGENWNKQRQSTRQIGRVWRGYPDTQRVNLTHLEAGLPQLLETARREQWTYETMLEGGIGCGIGRTRTEGQRQATEERTHSW